MSENKDKNIDKVSFALGGLICSLLSIAATVYFIHSLSLIYTLAKITIFLFLLFIAIVIAYQIKRGKIWELLVGTNLFQAKDNLSESIRTLIPGLDNGDGETINPTQAIKNISAIYGDFQVRKLMIFSALGAFGAFSALITAAFLIQQTSILVDQIETSKAIAKSESLHRPYWQLMHTDSMQTKRTLLTDLLYQGESSKFNNLSIDNFEFTPISGYLSKTGFTCSGCNFTQTHFRNLDLSGDINFWDGEYIFLSFYSSKIEDINFTNTIIRNIDERGDRRSLFSETDVQRLVMRETKWIGGGVYGLEDKDVTTLGIKHMAGVEMHDLVFSDVNITAQESTGDAFYRVSFHNVKFLGGSMTSLNLSGIDIHGTLIFDQVHFDSVSFSHDQLACIEGITLNTPGITWVQSTGKCIRDND